MKEIDLGHGLMLSPKLQRSSVEFAFPFYRTSDTDPNQLNIGLIDRNGRDFYVALIFSGQVISYAILVHKNYRGGRAISYDFDVERAADRDNRAWIRAFFGATPPIEAPRLSVSHAFEQRGGFAAIKVSFPSLGSWPVRLLLRGLERLVRPSGLRK